MLIVLLRSARMYDKETGAEKPRQEMVRNISVFLRLVLGVILNDKMANYVIRQHLGTEITKDIRKIKIQSPENICKAFFLFTYSTFTTHRYLLLNMLTIDRNALSEPGKEFFLFQHRRNLPPALLAMENSS
jgi:hypothetical protein